MIPPYALNCAAFHFKEFVINDFIVISIDENAESFRPAGQGIRDPESLNPDVIRFIEIKPLH